MPELLAPAGSPAALTAALKAGADAVYLGAGSFNARINAKNFTLENLPHAVAEAHEAGAKLYLTLNTLVYDREMRDWLATAEAAYLAGVDALIVADLGGAMALRRTFPDMPLHASTQMSGHNADAARRLAALGFERMVLARELSADNIAEFCKNSPIEAEVFVHGALCVCHSGQCLFSSIVGGRSGNRGECAQPCRLPYTTAQGKGYPLSLKDLSLAEHLPRLIYAGVASLKIEGRMKAPEYVAAVTAVWRNLLDERRAATEREMRYLANIFSRSGFTDGYYTESISRRMLGVRTESDKAKSSASDIKIKKAERRTALPTRADGGSRAGKYEKLKPSGKRTRTRTAYFSSPAQYTAAARDFFDLAFIPAEQYAAAVRTGIRFDGVALPPVIPDSEKSEVAALLNSAKRAGARHALVGNVGHIDLCLEAGLIPHGDFRLNVCNAETAAALEALGFSDFILSPELTLPRIRDIGGDSRAIVYGRLPLMITEKCVGKECGTCRDCENGKACLTDRVGKKFPVLRVFRHRSMIVNSLPTYMGDCPAELRSAGIIGEHYIFTTESAREVDRIISAQKKNAPIGSCRRIAKK